MVLAFAIWFGWAALLPVQPQQTTFFLCVPAGAPGPSLAISRSEALIRSSAAFLMVDYAKGLRTLKAGEYKFDQSASAFEVWRRLTVGDVYARTVVVPEGYNMFDIATAVEQAGLGRRRTS